MARRPVDAAAERKRLLDAIEALILKHGSAKASVSDAAAMCGMSQSNAYRFFPSKAALMAAVADRWFEKVETAVGVVADGPGPGIVKLRAMIVAQYAIKRAQLDADEALFAAYLNLAAANPEAPRGHVTRLRAAMLNLVKAAFTEGHFTARPPGRTAALIEAATVAVRDPWQIRDRRRDWTLKDTQALVDAVLSGLD
ncbi:MAG: TetR/AcrR family transcriptional regulator [Micropepsaceae bacterium]